MAAIARTAADIAAVNEYEYVSKTYVAAVAIEAGQAVHVNTDGQVALANGGAAGTTTLAGVALRSVSAGDAVNVLLQGSVAGFDLSSQAYGDPVYLSNTAGTLDDVAGLVSVVVGRVDAMSERGAPKVLRVNTLANA